MTAQIAAAYERARERNEVGDTRRCFRAGFEAGLRVGRAMRSKCKAWPVSNRSITKTRAEREVGCGPGPQKFGTRLTPVEMEQVVLARRWQRRIARGERRAK